MGALPFPLFFPPRQLLHIRAGCCEEPPALKGRMNEDYGQEEGKGHVINERFQKHGGTAGGNESGHCGLHAAVTGSNNGPRLGESFSTAGAKHFTILLSPYSFK